MREALAQAQRGRLFILDKMNEAISAGREKMSSFAPRIYTLQIPVDKIRDVIGPGGKMIRSIIEQTGVKIDVEDSGKINVASNDEASANKALQIIRDLTATAGNRQDVPRQGVRVWRTSAHSWKSFPAPTACCTSAKWLSIALRTSATNSKKAIRCW